MKNVSVQPLITPTSLLTEVFAEAGLLEASKRRSHIGFIVGVDEYGSSFEPLAHVHGLVDVAGEHARGQAVLRVVGSMQHALYIAVVWSKRVRRRWLASQIKQHQQDSFFFFE